MRTVSNISTILGTAYLAASDGQSVGTSIIPMLNLALPRLYEMGPWKALLVETQINCTAGYAVLPPDYESILAAMVNDAHVPIQSMLYEYQHNGPGIISQPASTIYGIIDEGYVTLMSDPPDGGIEELIFTSTSAFASGDIATITYTDTDEGYTQVALPLATTTVASASSPAAISAAADGGTDSATGEVLTTLTTANNASMGLVAGLGLTLSQLTGTDASYIGTFRIHSIPTTTSVKIVKSYVALTGTLAAVTTPRLMPVSTISSVESLVYTSLPARTVVSDLDETIYGILPAGDGVSQYRRYKVPQPEEDTATTYTLQAVCKRAFIPLTANTDQVYLDNLNVLRHAFLAIIAEDHSDLETAGKHWGIVKNILNEELATARGGIQARPNLNIWGDGIAPMPYRY